jgi:hypothetical protein
VRADRRPPGAGGRVSILDTLKRLTGVSTVRTGPTEEGAMKFLCLAYYDEQKFATLSEAELDAIGRACRPYDSLTCRLDKERSEQPDRARAGDRS